MPHPATCVERRHRLGPCHLPPARAPASAAASRRQPSAPIAPSHRPDWPPPPPGRRDVARRNPPPPVPSPRATRRKRSHRPAHARHHRRQARPRRSRTHRPPCRPRVPPPVDRRRPRRAPDRRAHRPGTFPAARATTRRRPDPRPSRRPVPAGPAPCRHRPLRYDRRTPAAGTDCRVSSRAFRPAPSIAARASSDWSVAASSSPARADWRRA